MAFQCDLEMFFLFAARFRETDSSRWSSFSMFVPFSPRWGRAFHLSFLQWLSLNLVQILATASEISMKCRLCVSASELCPKMFTATAMVNFFLRSDQTL